MTCLQLVPYLSTSAGSCLTNDNWYELGITTVAYDLTALLMKPGLDALLKIGDLKAYFGWDHDLVLDASRVSFDNQSRFIIKSQYDGATCVLNLDDFWTLLGKLNPTMVLLPKGLDIKREWPISGLLECCETGYVMAESIVAMPQRTSAYFIQDEQGVLNPNDYIQSNVRYYASDKPARDAYQGWVYQSKQKISIENPELAHCFEVIDPTCACPTCKQQFTCAYLHHLYQSTPLLCQRLLMMHNVFEVRSQCEMSY